MELGHDDDGDPITTCVIREQEAPSHPTKRRGRRLNPKQDLVLRAVHLCIEAGPTQTVPPSPGVPPGTKGVRRDDVKERAKAEGYDDGSLKPESVRRKLNDHLTTLIGMELLRGKGALVWPV